MGQHQPHDLNKSAARKSQYDRIRHVFLPVSAPLGASATWQSCWGYSMMIHMLQTEFCVDTYNMDASSPHSVRHRRGQGEIGAGATFRTGSYHQKQLSMIHMLHSPWQC